MYNFHKSLFLTVDVLVLNFAILFSYLTFEKSSWDESKSSIIYLHIYSNLAWFFLVLVSRTYNVTKSWSILKILKNQIAFIIVHLLVIASLIVFFGMEYTWSQIIAIYLIFTPLFFLTKLGVFYIRKVISPELDVKYFIIIGKNPLAFRIRKYYLMNPETGYRFKGYIDFIDNQFPISIVRDFCAKNDVHEIHCAAIAIDPKQLKQLVDFGLDSFIKVKVISDFSEPTIQLEQHETKPGLNLVTIALDETSHRFTKRAFDILFSTLFILLVMSWLTLIITLLIKLDSKGPVFFKQLRSGKGNEPFTCLKFRTMSINVESDTKQATKDDPRITRLGNVLRKTSLDELPQFFNVFLGSMSVVGPRPHMLKHTVEYSKLIETFMGRHYVKPGITGLAQCLGYRGETRTLGEMENRVRLDRYYIENWTFWLDIKIIFLTVVSLIRGSDKAY